MPTPRSAVGGAEHERGGVAAHGSPSPLPRSDPRSPLLRAQRSASSRSRRSIARQQFAEVDLRGSHRRRRSLGRLCALPVHRRCRGACHGRRLLIVLQQLLVALLLLARPALQALDQLALDQRRERLVHGGEVAEGVHALGALLELARRLCAAQHQHADNRLLAVLERQRFGEQVSILWRAAARAAGQPREAAAFEAVQRVADRRLVVVDHGLAVRRLVARQAQRVQRQRVGIGRGALLFHQAAEHADLNRAERAQRGEPGPCEGRGTCCVHAPQGSRGSADRVKV